MMYLPDIALGANLALKIKLLCTLPAYKVTEEPVTAPLNVNIVWLDIVVALKMLAV